MTGYTKSIAAASAAADALANLIAAIHEEDAIDVDSVLTSLVDACKLVIEIEQRDQDNQLLGAIEKWLEGD